MPTTSDLPSRATLERRGWTRTDAPPAADCEWCGFAGLDMDDAEPAYAVLAPDGAPFCSWSCARHAAHRDAGCPARGA